MSECASGMGWLTREKSTSSRAIFLVPAHEPIGSTLNLPRRARPKCAIALPKSVFAAIFVPGDTSFRHCEQR